MKHAIQILEKTLQVMETNEPINRENGNLDQAQLEADTAKDLRTALTFLKGGYQPHQKRVIHEKLELDERLDKLMQFIGGPVFDGISATEQDKLKEQRTAMCVYSTILGERIRGFAGGAA